MLGPIIFPFGTTTHMWFCPHSHCYVYQRIRPIARSQKKLDRAHGKEDGPKWS